MERQRLTIAHDAEASALPPQAPEVEQAVLGALLLDPKAWSRVADRIRRELFYVDAHREIFDAMWSMYHKGHPVDLLTTANALRAHGALETIGGPFFLSQLSSKVSSTANLEYHLTLLTDKLISRSLVTIGARAKRLGLENPEGLDALDKISADITDLYSLTASSNLTTAADGLEALTDKEEPKFLTYGIAALDAVAVLEAGVPSVFAGRPGMGKSVLSVEVLWHLTLKGPVLGFFPEMTRRQVQARVISRESGVPYSRILRKALGPREMDLVTSTIARIADRMRMLKIDDTAGITPVQVRSRTERAMKQEGVIAIGIDHLHKMKTGDAKVNRDDFARASQCMGGITEIAKNTGLPTLVMAQLNRGVEARNDKRPTLSDLRGSGQIEEDAAVVGLLYRPGYYDDHKPETDQLIINIAKNRDGAQDVVNTVIHLPCNRIESPGLKPATKTTEHHDDQPAPF